MLAKIVELDVDNLAPAYALAGQDAYMKQKTLKAFQDKWSSDGQPSDFDYSFIKAEESSIYRLTEACLAMPFMHSKVLVVCDQADNIAKDKELQDYLKNPSPTTCLVLLFRDKRKLNKVIKDHCEVGSLDPLDERGFQQWLDESLKQEGVSIDRSAKQMLVDRYHDNLLQMEQELNKLILFAGPNRSITSQAVQELVCSADQVGVFELIDAMTARNYGLFFKRLQVMLQSGTSAHEIVGVLLWHFKRLWSVQQCYQQGLSSHEIGQMLNMKEWALQKVAAQARRLSSRDYCDVFDKLYHLDISLKNNRLSANVLLQTFALS